MTNATIFYVNSQLRTHQERPFGVRYDCQIIPAGTVVVGFLKFKFQDRGKSYVEELIDAPPCMTSTQEIHFQECVSEARETLLHS